MKPIKIKIAEPCTENWEGMKLAPENGGNTPTGKFCDSCQKCVIDFTQYTDRELASYLRKNKGEICGRLMPAQLNRNLSPAPVSFWRNKVAAILLGISATLGFRSHAEARGHSLKSGVVIAGDHPSRFSKKGMEQEGKKTAGGLDTLYLRGQIINNETGLPVENAKIFVIGMSLEFLSDKNGRYEIEIPQTLRKDILTINIEKKDYESVSLTFDPAAGSQFSNVTLHWLERNNNQPKMGKFLR